MGRKFDLQKQRNKINQAYQRQLEKRYADDKQAREQREAEKIEVDLYGAASTLWDINMRKTPKRIIGRM